MNLKVNNKEEFSKTIYETDGCCFTGKRKICITSVGTATGIGVIKNIRKYKKNMKVIGTDTNPYGYTAGSLMVDTYYQVPLAGQPEYKEAMSKIIEEERVEYFFPINDVEIEEASTWKFPGTCDCVLPENSILKVLRDKLECTILIQQMGLCCPKILEQGYGQSCIIRDRVSVGSKGIRILDSVTNVDIKDDKFIQPYICGQEYTVDVLCDRDGRPFYIIPRVRMEVKAGVATKVKLENRNELIQIVQKILEHICLPGFSNFQFIHGCDGKDYFIEINPRIGGCTSASLLATPGMFRSFIKLFIDSEDEFSLGNDINPDVKWGSVITRYYEELLYEVG